MRTIKYYVFFGLCVVFMTCFGCNRGPVVLPVSGTVTYDGQPVSQAIITIVPKGSGGKPTQAGVMDGKFSIAKKFGVQTGEYMVTIEEATQEEGMISDIEPEEGVQAPTAQSRSSKRFGFRPYTVNHFFPENETNEFTIAIDIPKK